MITLSRFYALKLPVKINNLKHAFIENQLLVMYLRTMKITLINPIRTHSVTLYYFANFRFALTTPYFILKLKI